MGVYLKNQQLFNIYCFEKYIKLQKRYMKDLLINTINKFKALADYVEIRLEKIETFSLNFRGLLLENISRSTNFTGCVRAMILDIKEGIYVIRMLGGQTNGELFTFSSGEAFMIRNRKIGEPVLFF